MIRRLFDQLAEALIARYMGRTPGFIVGGSDNPYLLRWYLIPRNPVLNVYLHCFLRDDDDRALHDHPWPWLSLLLRNSYFEHTIAAGGIRRRQLRTAPSLKISGPRRAHRIELQRLDYAAAYDDEVPHSVAAPVPCWTLFITGPRMRSWGFHCPDRGWVHWRKFTDPNDTGRTGAGCGGGEVAGT